MKNMIAFSFVYDKVNYLYSNLSASSIDTVALIKIVFIPNTVDDANY